MPPSGGSIIADVCTRLRTAIHAETDTPVQLVVGCDDPIRVFVNDEAVFADDGRQHADPFAVFRIDATLGGGLNRITVVVGNTDNTNWRWNGFSLVVVPTGGQGGLTFMA